MRSAHSTSRRHTRVPRTMRRRLLESVVGTATFMLGWVVVAYLQHLALDVPALLKAGALVLLLLSAGSIMERTNTQWSRSRFFRDAVQELAYSMYSTVLGMLSGAFYAYLHHQAVDIPTLLKLGAILVPVLFIVSLVSPWITAAMKWVFH
jgi:uncharacterized membrane protein YhdT